MLNPQIAFVDTVSWAIRGPFFSQSGLHAYHCMPPVSCTVVDVTPVQDRQALSQLLARAISPEGPGCFAPRTDRDRLPGFDAG